jgi:hypothetical protein
MATLNLPVSPPPIPAQPPAKRYRFGAAAGFAAALLLVVIGVDGAVPPYEAKSPQPGQAQKQSSRRYADGPAPPLAPASCPSGGYDPTIPGCGAHHGIPPGMPDYSGGNPNAGTPGPMGPPGDTRPGAPGVPNYGPGTGPPPGGPPSPGEYWDPGHGSWIDPNEPLPPSRRPGGHPVPGMPPGWVASWAEPTGAG